MKSLMSKIVAVVALVVVLSSCTDPEEVIVELEERTEVRMQKQDGALPPAPPVDQQELEEEHELTIQLPQ